MVQLLRTACGAIEDLSEIAIPLLKKERAEANPKGFDTSPAPSGIGSSGSAPSVVSKPQEESKEAVGEAIPEAPPGDFGVKAKEEHTEEKEPVHTVSKSPPAREGTAEASGEKKKKRKRKHTSGTGPKKEKSKRRKKAEKEEKTTDGAGSTGLNLDTIATTKEEKDQLVATLPQRFNLRPAPKGTVAAISHTTSCHRHLRPHGGQRVQIIHRPVVATDEGTTIIVTRGRDPVPLSEGPKGEGVRKESSIARGAATGPSVVGRHHATEGQSEGQGQGESPGKGQGRCNEDSETFEGSGEGCSTTPRSWPPWRTRSRPSGAMEAWRDYGSRRSAGAGACQGERGHHPGGVLLRGRMSRRRGDQGPGSGERCNPHHLAGNRHRCRGVASTLHRTALRFAEGSSLRKRLRRRSSSRGPGPCSETPTGQTQGGGGPLDKEPVERGRSGRRRPQGPAGQEEGARGRWEQESRSKEEGQEEEQESQVEEAIKEVQRTIQRSQEGEEGSFGTRWRSCPEIQQQQQGCSVGRKTSERSLDQDPAGSLCRDRLDGKEKVRRRVARRARKLVRRKKAERSGSSSRSSSTGNDEDLDIGQDEGFFESETKVQKVAEACPGALAARSIVSMRKVLLESAGLDAEEQLVSTTAVKYSRQELQKKTSGPVSRELVTLCSAVDHLLRGRAAQAMDCMLQRVKSVETTIAGSHWSVSQRLELPPLDMQTIAPREEIISAQKAAAIDARSRFLAAQPDGRGKTKGPGKSKEQPHQEWRNDRERGKGKSSGKKDKGKKKEEG